MTLADGVPEWLPGVEQATCAAALHCSTEEVRSQGLEGADFYLRGCGQVWDAALRTEEPTILTVAALLKPAALPEMQRWIGDWWLYCGPGALRAHAALVKRDSERRKRLAELGKEAAAVGRGDLGPRGVAARYRDEL